MKHFIILRLTFVFFIIAACSAKVDSTTPLVPVPSKEDSKSSKDSSNNSSDGIPSFKETLVDGQLYGETWVAKSAFVRKFGTEEKKAIIFLVPISVENPCEHAFQNIDASVSIVIPYFQDQTDYLYDTKSGSNTTNPALIYRPGQNQVLADITKLKIGRIEKNRFDLSIYVKAVESNNRISEINGKINVIDCRNN